MPDIPLCNNESLSLISGYRRDLSQDITQAFSPIRLWIITNTQLGLRFETRLEKWPPWGLGFLRFLETFWPISLQTMVPQTCISTEVPLLLIRALQNHAGDTASLSYLNFIIKSRCCEFLSYRCGVFEIGSSPDFSRQSSPNCLNVGPRIPWCLDLLKLITKNFCVSHLQSNTTIFHLVVH